MTTSSVVRRAAASLPWSLPEGVLYLDIETRKVAAPAEWPLRQRWQPFMLGVSFQSPGQPALALVVSGEEEATLLDAFRTLLHNERIQEIRYDATHAFDELVLRGRFTSSRRAPLTAPGAWPHLNELPIRWRNIHAVARPTARAPRDERDCLSKDVPRLWQQQQVDTVVHHCFLDVVLLVWSDPDVPILSTAPNSGVARLA